MNGKYYIGPKVSDFERYNDEGPVAGVRVLVDNDNAYIAGDQTGYVIEVECPYGTQEMANNLLSSLSGITYKGYRANAAVLSPQAELGDGVDVNGLYSVLAYRKVEFGPGHMSEVAAPGDSEAEHEYDYTPQSQKELDYQIAQTRSLISKTSEEIRLEVANEVEGLSSSIAVELDSITARIDGAEDSIEVAISTLDGLTVTDSGGTTKIKGSSIETGTLYVDAANVTGTLTASQIDATNLEVSAANITGTLSASQINLTGAISWSDLASDAQSRVTSAQTTASNASSTANSASSTANSASSTAASAYSLASSVNSTVSGWQYSGTTYIDGTKLMTGTVYASYLKGGSIGILNSSGTQIGYITVGSSTSTGIQLISSGNLHLASSGCKITMADNRMFLSSCQYFHPSGTASYLGYSSYGMWQAVYSYTGAIQTSDRNLKHDIEDLPDKYLNMLSHLAPKRFKMDTGTSDRYHVGYIAQEVEAAMEQCGVDSQEFGGFVKDVDADGNGVYMLRYEEFIAIHTLAAQRHEERIKAMGEEIEYLKSRLEAAGL